MHRLLLLFLFTVPLLAGESFAQANAQDVPCDACRDANRFPEDVVNFAFNQIYGPDAWMTFDEADDFFVTNLLGQRVYVDADFVFDGFDLGGFDLPYLPRYLLQFTLALPRGTIYVAHRSVFQTSLPVPASLDNTTDGTSDSSTGGGGEDGDEDWDSDPDEWQEPEFDDPVGTVEIEDPDENGEFEEWCEEC